MKRSGVLLIVALALIAPLLTGCIPSLVREFNRASTGYVFERGQEQRRRAEDKMLMLEAQRQKKDPRFYDVMEVVNPYRYDVIVRYEEVEFLPPDPLRGNRVDIRRVKKVLYIPRGESRFIVVMRGQYKFLYERGSLHITEPVVWSEPSWGRPARVCPALGNERSYWAQDHW